LVVIAIIGVLVGLLLAAVFKVLDAAYEAQTRTDITQLTGAVEIFKQKYGVSYIPSRIVLCKQLANYYVPGTNPPQIKSQLHQDSLQYLSQVWPRLNWQTIHPPVPPANVIWQGIDWVGDGQPPPPPASNLDPILEGEQCLVFFLGGIPSYLTGTVTGFSTNGSDPSWHTYVNPPGDIVAPFFDFKSNRLVHFSQLVPAMAGINDFYVYMDGYGKTPYAYFSSYKTPNGYNRYWALQFPYSPTPAAPVSDCSALGVWPYAQAGIYFAPPPPNSPSTPVYLNSQSYQIVSAGKDYIFGPGTVITGTYTAPNGVSYLIGGPDWAPSFASQVPGYQQGFKGGYDDISNFYDRLLGVSSQ
jgi:hypothetical protein